MRCISLTWNHKGIVGLPGCVIRRRADCSVPRHGNHPVCPRWASVEQVHVGHVGAYAQQLPQISVGVDVLQAYLGRKL